MSAHLWVLKGINNRLTTGPTSMTTTGRTFCSVLILVQVNNGSPIIGSLHIARARWVCLWGLGFHGYFYRCYNSSLDSTLRGSIHHFQQKNFGICTSSARPINHSTNGLRRHVSLWSGNFWNISAWLLSCFSFTVSVLVCFCTE